MESITEWDFTQVVGVHLKAENASAGLLARVFYGAGPQYRPECYGGRVSEDERLELLRSVSDAHASLADAALELRRRLGRSSSLSQKAVRAEQGVLRLKRELQRFDLSEPPPPLEGRGLPEARPDQQSIVFVRLRQPKLHDEES